MAKKGAEGFGLSAISSQKSHFFGPALGRAVFISGIPKKRGGKKRGTVLALCFLFFSSLRFDSVQIQYLGVRSTVRTACRMGTIRFMQKEV